MDTSTNSTTSVSQDPLHKTFVADGLIANKVEYAHSRNDNGLIDNVCYTYKNGFIDWEALFNPELMVYPKGKDKDPLLKADGLRDLAELRGVKNKHVRVISADRECAVVSVTMEFIPNVEDPGGRIWEATADATVLNVGDKRFSRFLTTIAETRATARCIREALRIRRYCMEEFCPDDIKEEENISETVLAAIRRQMELKKYSMDQILAKIREKLPSVNSLEELSYAQGQTLLKWISEQQNSNS